MTPAAWTEVDDYVAAFEAAHAAGGADPAGFLPPPDDPRYAEVLAEVVRVDLELGSARGRPRRVEDYLARFPALRDPAVLGAVAFEEYRLRRQAGEAVEPAEYAARFGVSVRGWPAPAPDATLPLAAAEHVPTGDGGRYRLGGEIARGGMGAVLRASDPALDRDVAVKVLLGRHGDDPAMRRRFVEEARIAGRLQHPGIPPVHDLGTLPDGRPFLAMKLIEGRTLEAHLRDRPDPGADVGRLVAVFEQVCQAVGYAHSQGVVHRDLKPSNVMVGEFGEVQVMDWGLAKAIRGPLAGRGEEDAAPGADATGPRPGSTVRREADTRAGTVLGTPAYMAPEQARGDLARVDERADVFALGGILCAVLTGHPPYSEPDAGATAARADLTAALAGLDRVRGEPGLVALAKRCLAADPADRPPDARAVAAEVAALRAAAEDRARRAEADRAAAEVRAVEGRKRRRVRRALVAALPEPTTALAVTADGRWVVAAAGGQLFRLRADFADDAELAPALPPDHPPFYPTRLEAPAGSDVWFRAPAEFARLDVAAGQVVARVPHPGGEWRRAPADWVLHPSGTRAYATTRPGGVDEVPLRPGAGAPREVVSPLLGGTTAAYLGRTADGRYVVESADGGRDMFVTITDTVAPPGGGRPPMTTLGMFADRYHAPFWVSPDGAVLVFDTGHVIRVLYPTGTAPVVPPPAPRPRASASPRRRGNRPVRRPTPR